MNFFIKITLHINILKKSTIVIFICIEARQAKAFKRRQEFIKLALGTKAFTEGFYEGQKDLGSPKKHHFRDNPKR